MKTIDAILKKHGVKPLLKSSIKKAKGPNNESRDKFKEFCTANGYQAVGRTNSFIYNNKLYGFCVTIGDKPECRQFSEQYAGFVCEMPSGHLVWLHSKDSIKLSGCTRIGPDGTKYYNATGV